MTKSAPFCINLLDYRLSIWLKVDKIWFSRRLAAVAVIEEASSVRERNDAEDRDTLALIYGSLLSWGCVGFLLRR